MSQFEQEYTILEIIGSGAFAEVYKIKHNTYGYVRALKRSKELVTGQESKAFKTFINECRYLLNIGNGCHPNIVRIYHPQLVDNHAIVEMDYVKGETLFKYVDRLKFVPIEEVYNFISGIAGALAYCHEDIYQFLIDPNEDVIDLDPESGKPLIDDKKRAELISKYKVIHNDLHSNNIMRREYDGMYMLLDFGLAIQNGNAVKSSSRNDGAFEYKAPEKWENESTITTETDIYGLGILMYEILTGRVPFIFDIDNSNSLKAQNEIYSCHKSAAPPAIEPLRRKAFEEAYPGQEYQKDYPDWLEQMILKCLEKDPQKRYANAKELLNDFKEHKKTITQSDNSELKSQISKLTEDNNELQNNNNKLTDQIEELITQLNELQGNAITLNKFKKNLEIEISELKQANKHKDTQLKSQSEENYSLKKEIIQKSDDLKIARQKITELENRTHNKTNNQNSISAKDLFYKGREYADKHDYASAFEYFIQAAKKGLGEAQFNVGYYYYKGQGVVTNKYKAIEWFELASNNGIKEATTALKSIKIL